MWVVLLGSSDTKPRPLVEGPSPNLLSVLTERCAADTCSTNLRPHSGPQRAWVMVVPAVSPLSPLHYLVLGLFESGFGLLRVLNDTGCNVSSPRR